MVKLSLSLPSGDPQFEVKAHQAMEAIWRSRHRGHNLVGSVINVHSAEWTRVDSGVGAGIDSYYELDSQATPFSLIGRGWEKRDW